MQVVRVRRYILGIKYIGVGDNTFDVGVTAMRVSAIEMG
ncbi:uncharacterized protein G2W53_019672 [Senna tora]|uniref:Uncharacterized protein n=1 Tax=Senna tora TaxID=362788 RepID=A0A834TU29_9FABA|nr:uncharacterized protein G2W53_019672 [Senna tora]